MRSVTGGCRWGVVGVVGVYVERRGGGERVYQTCDRA